MRSAEASGELLALLDADDLWEPTFLEEQVWLYDREQEREPGVGIISSDAYFLFPDGRADWTFEERYGAGGDKIDLTKLLETNPIYGGAMMPRAVVEEVGGFSPETLGNRGPRPLDPDRRARLPGRCQPAAARELPGRHRGVGDGEPRGHGADEPGDVTGWPSSAPTSTRSSSASRSATFASTRRSRSSPCSGPNEPVRSGGSRRRLPLFLSVALREPRRWPRWIRALATGKVAEW